jgi:succinate-semialdehyde dehydrogenase/glutarate-semialdehyde dehydrogenase
MNAPVPTTSVNADDERRLLDVVPTGLFIAGQWRQASNGATFDVEDPATGKMLVSVADATPDDGQAALAAAAAAQESWGATPPQERAELLRRSFEAVIARADEFALLMTLEMGKPLAQSHEEVIYGAEFVRWFSGEATRITGRYGTAPDGRTRILVHKRPVGPALFITPWNFPLAMATRKIAPALAAGCTVVVKPADLTPLTTALFTQVLVEAGLPAGVVNVLQSSNPAPVTGPIIADARLRKLSFTGSTPVGRILLAEASRQVLRTSMELGGNAPFLVFGDADLDAALDGAMIAKFRNMGQSCVGANRFLVHSSVAAEFGRRFAERAAAVTMARGTEPNSTFGPVIDRRSREKIHGLVTDAVEQGAKALTGGEPVDGPVIFTRPPYWPMYPRMRASCPRRCSDPSRRSSPLTPRTRRSRWPTAPNSVWFPTPTPRICAAACACWRASSRACSALTGAWCPTRPRLSAG